ncbi:MAG: VWA domain-containing protein [Deltaproteobacteria bacterium]|jgi:serine/threonine-protein kinase PpkA|nr:VWA domain-containing protein [Deltaproteobacteria bacterium]
MKSNKIGHKVLLVFSVLALSLFGAVSLWAQGSDRPLLIEGKKTLFQRVITHPGATAHKQPGGASLKDIPSFSALYIYEKSSVDGTDWLRVSPSSMGRETYWLKQELTSEWNRALVLLFSSPLGRRPILFFKTLDDLLAVSDEPNVTAALNRLEADFIRYRKDSVSPPVDFPIISREPDPETGKVNDDKFYLMPIFNYDDTTFDQLKLLEVGSINPGVQDLDSASMGRHPLAKWLDQPSDGLARRQPELGLPHPPSAGDEPILVAANNYPQSGSSSNIKVGLAFVIDTTSSMGPYIERCLALSRDLYSRIIEAGQQDNMALAVVAYRSSVVARPKTEYTSKIISPFTTAVNRMAFDSALAQVREATASTHAYSEDSLAGLLLAIEGLDWDPYTGRIILLITDAGPLPMNDRYNSTQHSPYSIAGLAKSKNINVIPVHIKTAAGRSDHMNARNAYTTISQITNGQPDYITIDVQGSRWRGDETFYATSEALMRNMEKQVFSLMAEGAASAAFEEYAAYGQGSSPPPPAVDEALNYSLEPTPTPPPAPRSAPPAASTPSASGYLPDLISEEAEAARQAYGGGELIIPDKPGSSDDSTLLAAQIGDRLGMSFKLQYLGDVNEVRPPEVVRSWITDKDLSMLEGGPSQDGKEVPTVEVAVLISKNQLSTIRSYLQTVIDEADNAMNTQSRDFFQSIIKASAQITTDPEQFKNNPEVKLADLGGLSEFLEDLPYKSRIMALTENDWYNMSAVDQDTFIRTLRSRVRLYSQYDSEVNNWNGFGGSQEGEWLFRMPLAMLP